MSTRAVQVHPQPVLLWGRREGGEGLPEPCLGSLWDGPSTEGNTGLGWAVPVLNPLAWHQGSTLALEPLWAAFCCCAGVWVLCACLGMPWGGIVSRLWAVPLGKWLPSAERLALKTPLFASAVLLLLATACAWPWGHWQRWSGAVFG